MSTPVQHKCQYHHISISTNTQYHYQYQGCSVSSISTVQYQYQVSSTSNLGFGSGGRFSSRFDRADAPWQTKAVEEYLRVVPRGPPFPPQEFFPSQGRGTPDISLWGWGYPMIPILLDGRVVVTGGTSASTPAFASMVSLLNKARLP